MKMKFLSSCAAILLAAVAQAQSSTQLRGGLNVANVSVTKDGAVDDAKMLTSFQLGFVGDVSLGKFISFQPGILFTGKGSKTQSGDPSSSRYYKSTFNPYYIEVPATVVLKAPIGSGSKFFAGAGPYLAVGVSGKNKVEGKNLGLSFSSEKNIEFSNDDPTTVNYEEGAGFGIVKRFDYGLNGTVGIEGKSIVLGAAYGLGLAKLQSGSNNSADNNNKHRVLSLFVGIKL
ncbi:MAG TPA: porin family protein [Chitinophagaceae bacterium]|nr:porin family protein [Chitinophagaceae bacterium]